MTVKLSALPLVGKASRVAAGAARTVRKTAEYSELSRLFAENSHVWGWLRTESRIMPITGTAEPGPQPAGLSSKRRNLIAACLAHALHDGYTDGLYAFLPAWQSQFGLSYAGIAIVRALYFGPMGALQMPANRLLRTLSPCAALVVSTLVAAVGFVFMAAPLGFAGLCVGLVVAGAGSSVQHPRGSLLVAETYAAAARRPLGILQLLGRSREGDHPCRRRAVVADPRLAPVVGLLALLGLGVTLALLTLSPRVTLAAPSGARAFPGGRGRSGFAWLMTIGAFDTATRMGYLLFLPFLIHARGGASASVGLGLSLLFIGGALGKATCGWLGEQLGVVRAVIATRDRHSAADHRHAAHAACGDVSSPSAARIVLYGTSSVLYGLRRARSRWRRGPSFRAFLHRGD